MRTLIPVLILLAAEPIPAFGEDARSIMAKSRQLQLERWDGVNSYAVLQSVMDQQTITIYERTEVQGADGRTHPVFQQARPTNATDPTTKAFLESYADGATMVGEGLGAEMDKGLDQAGLPRGLLGTGGEGPWVSMDPRVMMGGMASFTREVAAGEAKDADSPEADAASAAAGMAEFADRARLVGTEEIEGRKAFHLLADGLDHVQQTDGQTFELDTVHMWIDTIAYVPLRTQMLGTASTATESRPITIEKIDSDYREIAGSRMYEPFRQTMRIQGVMTPAQQQEMQTAQKQLAELEQQMAQMPESQRNMIMGRMGPQMESMRRMASGGGLETVTVVQRMLVNPTLADLEQLRAGLAAVSGPSLMMPPSAAMTGSAAPPVAADPASLQAAQQACLQQKMEQAQKAKQTERGFGRLLGAAGRVASRFGGADVSRAMGDVYSANATAADVSAAAKDLGLTDDDIEACKSPG